MMSKDGQSDLRMTDTERRASISLAGTFTLRMLGLFMVFPVFSLNANQYEGHTPILIGLAIGIFGSTQALFQIPFGMASDRIGRMKVIVTDCRVPLRRSPTLSKQFSCRGKTHDF